MCLLFFQGLICLLPLSAPAPLLPPPQLPLTAPLLPPPSRCLRGSFLTGVMTLLFALQQQQALRPSPRSSRRHCPPTRADSPLPTLMLALLRLPPRNPRRCLFRVSPFQRVPPATTNESSPLPPPGRSIQRERRKDAWRYPNATSWRKLDRSFVILIVDPKYFLANVGQLSLAPMHTIDGVRTSDTAI
ncbi:hypothetical protein MUK42_24936 [Musa troglodytarum]|uniref:Uncharacterized protein n=1 Tax=Musa troglodytarum TaxID=320322 RepID=A0A9E7I0Q1_9LILI|nr:hypothetical protein MUK42_24936 [Musa troglodytarum]